VFSSENPSHRKLRSEAPLVAANLTGVLPGVQRANALTARADDPTAWDENRQLSRAFCSQKNPGLRSKP
jgi:hypothetical protein